MKKTSKISLDINNLFERKVEEGGTLLYTTGDKSVRIAIWNEEEKSKEQLTAEYKLFADNRDQTQAKTLDKFDFSDDEVARIGYLIKEDDNNKDYNVIYGFSIIDNQIIQVTIYFDEDEELNWAIQIWKHIKF